MHSRKDGQTDTTKLIVNFRNFLKVPKVAWLLMSQNPLSCQIFFCTLSDITTSCQYLTCNFKLGFSIYKAYLLSLS